MSCLIGTPSFGQVCPVETKPNIKSGVPFEVVFERFVKVGIAELKENAHNGGLQRGSGSAGSGHVSRAGHTFLTISLGQLSYACGVQAAFECLSVNLFAGPSQIQLFNHFEDLSLSITLYLRGWSLKETLPSTCND